MSLHRRLELLAWIGLSFLLHVVYSRDGTCVTEENGEEGCSEEDENATLSPDPSTLHNMPSSSSCGLYIAPSTIPNAGLGIFTGRDLSKGDDFDMHDVAIPLFDMKAHYFFTMLDEHSGTSTATSIPEPEYDFASVHWFFPFESYVWQGWAMGMLRETSPNIVDIEAFCPGLDAAINSMLPLINVGGSDPSYELSGLHRSTHAMAGAISPYVLGGTKAIEDIPAGGECFKSYGDYWFAYRQQIFGDLPLTDDHERAEQALGRFVEATKGLTDEMKSNVWEFVVKTMKPKLGPSRYLNALPDSVKDAALVGTEGVRAYYQPNATRSIEELQEIGRCIDHIYAGLSTLPQAGKGAFARRRLRSGDVVSATPLLHQPYRSIAKVHHLAVNPETENIRRVSKDNPTEQLLVNYCFAHAESTVLLCPYGAGIDYINHHREHANVRVRWVADTVLGHNATWLELPVEHMQGNHKVSLTMEYVALRDIEQDEEFLLDYGNEFEEALQKHFAEWKPPSADSRWHYVSSHVWNERFSKAPLRTYTEQQLDPYPPHLETHCHPSVFGDSLGEPLDEFAEMSFDLNQRGVLCWVMARYLGEDRELLYDVEAAHYHGDFYIRKKDVPRDKIAFGDVPYSTDMHRTGAFRHPMHIPEDMFPIAWKNKKIR